MASSSSRFRKLAAKFRIRELAYDNRYAEDVTQTIEQGQTDAAGKVIEEGTGIERVVFPQNVGTFCAPVADFERFVIAHTDASQRPSGDDLAGRPRQGLVRLQQQQAAGQAGPGRSPEDRRYRQPRSWPWLADWRRLRSGHRSTRREESNSCLLPRRCCSGYCREIATRRTSSEALLKGIIWDILGFVGLALTLSCLAALHWAYAGIAGGMVMMAAAAWGIRRWGS
jgi:hypothetical protein